MEDNPNKELENAANALNEAAVESEAPTETPVEAPVDEKMSAEMDAALAEADASAAPETPEVPATPAEAAPVVENPTPVEAPAPVEAPTSVAETPKKGGKKGLVIGVAVGAVALLGAGGFALAYTMNNSEENIALSAISDLFSNHAKTVDGYFELATVESDDVDDRQTMTNCIGDTTGLTNKCSSSSIVTEQKNPISRVRVELKNSTNADNETSTSATFIVTYNDKDYKITLGSVVVKDYTIYISISDLKDTIKTVLEDVKKDTYTTMYYGDQIELYEDLINKVVGEVDGIWWKISIPDLVDSTDAINASDKTKIKEAYSCVVDVANKATKDGGKFAELYKKNAFVGISKYTGSAAISAVGDHYNIKLDAEKFANFVNEMGDQVESYGIEDCVKKLDGVSGTKATYSREKVEAKQVEESFKALNDTVIISIENGFFSHKLSGIYFAKENDEFSGKLDLKISDLKGTISAPSDSKDISELVKNVTKAYTEWEETATCKYYKKNYTSLYTRYCDATTDKMKTTTKSSTSQTYII